MKSKHLKLTVRFSIFFIGVPQISQLLLRKTSDQNSEQLSHVSLRGESRKEQYGCHLPDPFSDFVPLYQPCFCLLMYHLVLGISLYHPLSTNNRDAPRGEHSLAHSTVAFHLDNYSLSSAFTMRLLWLDTLLSSNNV